MAKLRIVKVLVGRLLNHLFHSNLEVCAGCGRFTTWEEDRLMGDFMYCPLCDMQMMVQLRSYGEGEVEW